MDGIEGEDTDEEFDVDDTHDDDTGGQQDDETDSAPTAGGGEGARAPRRVVDAGTVRRIAAKAIALAQASEDDRELLAFILGSNTTDPVALTATVFRTTSAVLAPVTALLELADAEATFAAVSVMSWDKSRVRQVWALAARLDIVPAHRPQKETQTAIKLATAVGAMTPAARQRLTDVTALTRRTA